ncbi:uncharacterized protein SOCE26_092800 [Sorangium cellulosum]|uniref:Cytochrome P450 n=1 Tax=Sorangium cellulosum TaxID=56 RepID=A0A2L0F843_SORCE|nr:uncharacterized protein SOCE26_092800 [Sorangium cellulosum]
MRSSSYVYARTQTVSTSTTSGRNTPSPRAWRRKACSAFFACAASSRRRRRTTTLVSKATTSGPLPDAGLHLVEGRGADGLGGPPCEEILGFVEDRRQDQPPLVIDTNVDLAARPELELLTKRAGDSKLAFAAHRQGGHDLECKPARLTPLLLRRGPARGRRGDVVGSLVDEPASSRSSGAFLRAALAFGSGPRVCPGRALSLVESAMVGAMADTGLTASGLVVPSVTGQGPCSGCRRPGCAGRERRP